MTRDDGRVAFTMPSLGADMDQGVLLEWLVTPGDTVRRGDLLAVVDTSKAAVEIESFADGVVDELVAAPGATVPVGGVLAVLRPLGQHPAPAASGPAASAPPVSTPPVSTPPVSTPPVSGPPVSGPLVRTDAARLGVDLAGVTGTGAGGAVTRADVARAAGEAPPTSPVPTGARSGRVPATPYARRLAQELGVDLDSLHLPDDRPVRAEDIRAAVAASPSAAPPPAARATAPSPTPPPSFPPAPTPTATSGPPLRTGSAAMRATIAALMARSKREIPHYYLSTTVDLHRALTWMRERNQSRPVSERLVPAALMLKATALAVLASPELNGFWEDDGFRAGAGVHLGVAVALRGGGLVAPAIHDADRLSLDELMQSMRDLVARARAGRLRGREMQDPTITVTNLGDQGVEAVHGVIYPPQVALVGFGRVVERPWAVAGMLTVRPVTTLTLAADHRATDGFAGARFLNDLDQHLQRPEEL